MSRSEKRRLQQLSAAEIDRLLDVTQGVIMRLQNSIDEATGVAQALELMRDEVAE